MVGSVRCARVELDQVSPTTPIFAAAVPYRPIKSSAGRSERSRRRPSTLVGDWRSAALSLALSPRQHLELATTSSSSCLRAGVGSTGTRSTGYLRRGCEKGRRAGSPQVGGAPAFPPHFSWRWLTKCYYSSACWSGAFGVHSPRRSRCARERHWAAHAAKFCGPFLGGPCGETACANVSYSPGSQISTTTRARRPGH